MRGDDPSPHNAVLAHYSSCVFLCLLSLVDIGDAFAHVIGCVLSVLDAIDFKSGLAAVLVATVAFVAQMDSIAVESD